MPNSAAGSLMSRITLKTEDFWNSRLYFPVMLAVTAISMLTGNVVPSTVLLAALCGWLLVFCRDILAAATPFLMIFLLSTLHYSSLSVFLPCAPLAVLPLGGLGTIPSKEYFSPLSLYYTLGLGLGLLVTYLLLRSDLEAPRPYDLLHRLMQLLYTLGLAIVLPIACFYMKNWAEFSRDWTIPCILFRNYAATILVSTIPAVFYMVRRSRWHLAALLLWAMALFFSGSRTALLFGTVMLLLGMIFLTWQKVLPLWVFFITLALAGTMVLLLGPQIYDIFFGTRGDPDHFISPSDSRWTLLARGWKDFVHHPLFGIGLGNQQNIDLFSGVPGSMVFYHNAVVQVMGSMGLAGLAAYGLLLASRMRLALRGGEAGLVVGMFYAGMLLVSMTNPGLFCPLPNALLTVLCFAVLEKYTDDSAQPLAKSVG